MSTSLPTFVPPGPKPLSPVIALLRTALGDEGNLLSLLPAEAYRVPIGPLGYSRRQIVIVNEPSLVREVLHDDGERFPKSDLMVDATAPLIGDAMFVSSGERWRRQRAMIDPAFSHMRVSGAFGAMAEAVDAFETRLDGFVDRGEVLDLDLAMSQLTADVICRTIFSTGLDSDASREVFDCFETFENGIGQVNLLRLIFAPAFAKTPHPPAVLEACARIRARLGEFVDPRLDGRVEHDDICGALIDARHPETGERFDREALVDQLGVFFLAGHETTASVLTWLFYLLVEQPGLASAIREEVRAVVGDAEITYEHTRQLPVLRAIFRETARLYPPITFLPRVALQATRLGERRLKRGALVMVSPWTIHRHETLWRDAHRFDASRFLPGSEESVPAGAYIPFGHGPRVCVGAAFATTESLLIVARLLARYAFEAVDAGDGPVEPVARLTTRPRHPIRLRVHRQNDRT